jgi:hypothetical protein
MPSAVDDVQTTDIATTTRRLLQTTIRDALEISARAFSDNALFTLKSDSPVARASLRIRFGIRAVSRARVHIRFFWWRRCSSFAYLSMLVDFSVFAVFLFLTLADAGSVYSRFTRTGLINVTNKRGNNFHISLFEMIVSENSGIFVPR